MARYVVALLVVLFLAYQYLSGRPLERPPGVLAPDAPRQLLKDALNTAFDTSTALEIVTFQSDDHREALAAIREKRQPSFRGR